MNILSRSEIPLNLSIEKESWRKTLLVTLPIALLGQEINRGLREDFPGELQLQVEASRRG